jgi:hypothetical protein
MATVHKDIRPSLGFESDTTEAVRLASKLSRGRGARSNASGRYEPLSRHLVDDGGKSLEELPPFKTTVIPEQAQDHSHAQQLPRHFLRPLDQSVSRFASTAAATAMPGRPTPIWACLPGSISKASFSPS